MMMNETNEIDIFSMGYGHIAKLVMKDKDLTVEAKAIYSYIASYAGASDTAYPSVDLICYDLSIGKERFQKHKKCLIEKGYIVIRKHSTPEGKFTNNLYVLSQTVAKAAKTTEMATELENPLPDFTAKQDPSMGSTRMENRTPNSNSVTNNNLTTNHSKDLLEEDEEDTQVNRKEKNQQTDFDYWQKKWIAHFGEQTPYTTNIHEGLQQWARFFGDEEIIMYAFMRAGRYGAKSYAYLDSILRNWWDDGLRTADAIYDSDILQGY